MDTLRFKTAKAGFARSLSSLPVIAVATAVTIGASEAAAAQFYQRTNLVSNLPGLALFTDPHLAGAWGVVHSATSPWWINSAGGWVSLVVDGSGEPFPTNHPLVVTV